jgi:cyanophycinase
MSGFIVLMGGNEFRPDCQPMDRRILAGLGSKPRVVVLPTAAARENPGLAAENGVRHFNRLGGKAEAAMVVDSETAGDGKWLGLIRKADLVYLAGGDPVHLLETLRNSAVWEAALEVWKGGRALAGSSAGAMVLGGQMWAPGQGWRRGLGLLPRLAILPHHASLARAWKVKSMLSSIPDGTTLVGIDEATALVGPPWEVVGQGTIVVYEPDKAAVFRQGETVNLDPGMER